MTARLPRGEPRGDFGADLFEHRIAAVCGVESTPSAGQVAARGSAPASAGGLTLRLRDVELEDAFFVLSALTGRGFVVDPDGTGRVSVDLDDVTLDEALTAVRSAGVVVGPGPLSRVSRVGVAPAAAVPPGRTYAGSPVSLNFKRGSLIDVLRLFPDISQRELRTPPVVNGSVSIFCHAAPWDQALDAIAASAGLTSVVEKDAVFVGPAAMAGVPGRPGAVDVKHAKTTDDATRSGPNEDCCLVGLDAADLRLVGVARVGGAWRAYAYGPWRKLHVLETGAELFDGRVHAVGPTGVTFETLDGRRVEVALPR